MSEFCFRAIVGIGLLATVNCALAVNAQGGKPQHSLSQLQKMVAQASTDIARDGKNADAYRRRGDAYFELEEFDSAQADLQTAATMAPGKMIADDYRILGELYAQNDRMPEALSMFTRAVNLVIKNTTKLPALDGRRKWPLSLLYLRRAGALAALKRYPEALKDADQVVLFDPDKHWVYEFRAQLYQDSGRYREVVDDCTKALAIDPNLIGSYGLRAKAYDKMGDKKRADRDRESVRKLAKEAF